MVFWEAYVDLCSSPLERWIVQIDVYIWKRTLRVDSPKRQIAHLSCVWGRRASATRCARPCSSPTPGTTARTRPRDISAPPTSQTDQLGRSRRGPRLFSKEKFERRLEGTRTDLPREVTVSFSVSTRPFI